MNYFLVILMSIMLTGCSESGSVEQSENGLTAEYFNFAASNYSESSIELEKVIIDDKWHVPISGGLSCGGSNINGANAIVSVPRNMPAPERKVYLEWYSWAGKKRIKATVKLPPKPMIDNLLKNPPWFDKKRERKAFSTFIINIRPDRKVWIKLSKDSRPESQAEIMILGESTGYATDDPITRYENFKEGKDYTLDCFTRRQELKELGYYTAPLEVWDKWYPGAPQNKESYNEQRSKKSK